MSSMLKSYFDSHEADEIMIIPTENTMKLNVRVAV